MQIHRVLCFLVGAVIFSILVLSQPALAGMIADRQDRQVLTEEGASDGGIIDRSPQVVIIAPDFSPFDRTAAATASAGSVSSSGRSHQRSRIDSLSMAAAGELAIGAGAGEIRADTGANAGTYNVFQVFFTVDSPHAFSLTTSYYGSLIGDGIGRVDGWVYFASVGGSSLLDRRLESDTGDSVTITGTLMPDRYQLLAEFSLGGVLAPRQGGASFSGTAGYDVLLVVPEPSGLLLAGIGSLWIMRRRR